MHFDRLVHGRDVAAPGMDLSGTLGCLLSYAPTLLEIDPHATAEELLASVAGQMERLPGGQVNFYKSLGRDPVLRSRLDALPQAEVLFNYRGRIDDVIDRSSLFRDPYNLGGLDHDPDNLRLYPLTISMDIVENRLEARFVYSRNLHERASVAAMSVECMDGIRLLLGG